MKELTIEQKVKAYDEAIEKARLVLQEKGNEPDGASILSELFPELIESEDERIRKDMIETIKKESKDFPSSVIAEKSHTWIAWLEKQGKIVDYYEDRLDECACKYFNKGYKHALEKQDEQKSAEWSEEDENKYEAIVDIIKQKYDDTNLEKKFANRLINWLKSLKDRVLPQPKQEWSEEDAINLVNTIRALQSLGMIQEADHRYDNLIDWLKSLRPQTTWKPSDEQITWLYRAADDASKDSRMKQVLNELLEQLKAL